MDGTRLKSVAVVGAGPAGLVAAKTLVEHGFRVRVFEKADRVGGMWALEPTDTHASGKCSPYMRTNLSRFTVAFSDFGWERVGLGDGRTSGDKVEEGQVRQAELPMFPQAWQVGRYLQAYARSYIPSQAISLGCEVTSTELRSASDSSGRRQWIVRWKAGQPQPSSDLAQPSGVAAEEEDNFDYLVSASGFFGSPRPIGVPITGSTVHAPKIIHSSHYRSLTDLGIDPSNESSGNNVVVIGGSMSGIEAAATVATHLSNMHWGVQSKSWTKSSDDTVKYKVHLITTRPFHVLPRSLPSQPPTSASTSPKFLPLDLVMYSLSRRPEGPISPSNGLMPEQKARKAHGWIQGLVGKQTELGEATVEEDDMARPAYVGISDTFLGSVRSGGLVLHRGRVTSVAADESGTSVFVQTTAEETKTISDVGAIIYATGYEPHRSLAFFSEPTRELLSYSSTADRIPLLLGHHSTFASKLPELAFIGFYEGPFWGVMELQSRIVARRWQNERIDVDESKTTDGVKNVEAMREAMSTRNSQVPQFWMGDYVGLMEGMARDLGIQRNLLSLPDRSGPVVPARYAAPLQSSQEKCQEKEKRIATILSSVQNILSNKTSAFLVPTIFHELSGPWTMKRTLTSHLPGFPSGTLTGTCTFHPRAPTATGYEAEYLYVEQGTLRTDSGLELHASKRYAYRLGLESDGAPHPGISAWFVKDDGRTVDYFFHVVEFGGTYRNENTVDVDKVQLERVATQQGACAAEGSHLCEQDLYDSHYEFFFEPGTGVVKKWGLRYVVKGPRKDYVSWTWFER